MKPSLQVRLSQHLALTPQLQQSIRLLQLSTLELHQEVEQMLDQNPFLETEDEGMPAFEPMVDRSTPTERVAERETERADTPTESSGEGGDDVHRLGREAAGLRGGGQAQCSGRAEKEGGESE